MNDLATAFREAHPPLPGISMINSAAADENMPSHNVNTLGRWQWRVLFFAGAVAMCPLISEPLPNGRLWHEADFKAL